MDLKIIYLIYIMNYAIVDINTLEIINVYFSENGPDPLRNTDTQVQIEIPNNLDYFCIKAQDINTIIEDPDKIQIKNTNQWNYIKELRKNKLIESDWTCSVVDPPDSILLKRNEWLTYRQELRDITKQADPFNIIWPIPPS